MLNTSAWLEIRDGSLTEEGYFRGKAIVTGGPIVLDYTSTHGAHIYRPESEVFSDASMASLKGIPVTLGHPPQNVDGRTAKQVSIGFTGEQVTRIGDKLAVNFTITDAKIAAQVQSMVNAGQRVHFSIGARAKPVKGDGVFRDQKYQITITDIAYNHLALLLDDIARYPYTDVITDSDPTWLLLMDGQINSNSQEAIPVKIKLPNGAEIEVADATDARHLENHLLEHSKMATDIADQAGQLAQVTKQLTDAKGQILDSDGLNKAVAARVAVAAEAVQLLDGVDVMELATKTEREIREAVLLADGHTETELADAKASFGDRYDTYIAGIYGQIKKAKGASVSAGILDSAHSASGNTRTAQGSEFVVKDAFGPAKEAAQKKMEDLRKGKTHAN